MVLLVVDAQNMVSWMNAYMSSESLLVILKS